MLVYRIQCASNKGPYRNYRYCIDHDEYSPESDKLRPGPESDGIDCITAKCYFGFLSLEQLLRWFTAKDRRNFRRAGLKVAVYKVPPKYVYVGGKQVAFVQRKGKIERILDPLTLEEMKFEGTWESLAPKPKNEKAKKGKRMAKDKVERLVPVIKF